MGSAFATNLLSKRNEVHVYNRSKDRLRGLIAKGAVAHPSPIELGKSVDVLITSLPDQGVVDSMVMGDDGALGGMKKGALWIEMSTIDPDASIREAEQATRAGVDRVDAPVIGNPDMAAKGNLSLLVGGDENVFEKNREFLNQLGSTVIYLGKPGSGHKMKLILNLFLGTIRSSLLRILRTFAETRLRTPSLRRRFQQDTSQELLLRCQRTLDPKRRLYSTFHYEYALEGSNPGGKPSYTTEGSTPRWKPREATLHHRRKPRPGRDGFQLYRSNVAEA